jgi:hypothetical protein
MTLHTLNPHRFGGIIGLPEPTGGGPFDKTTYTPGPTTPVTYNKSNS